MTFTLDATPDPAGTPPRVRLDISSDNPGDSITSLSLTRDGVLVREQPYAGGSASVAFDYESPFGVLVAYRVDGTYLPVTSPDWTEAWANLTSWTGDTGSFTVSGGKARSTVPTKQIVRSAAGTIQRLDVTDPVYVRVELLDAASVVVASVQVDSKVTLIGSSSVSATGAGSFSLVLSNGVVSATAADASWALSRPYTGTPTKVRVVSLQAGLAETLSFAVPGSSLDDVAVDGAGNIYTVDYTAKLIHKFTSAGTHVTTGGFPISTTGSPINLFVDSSGNIFVSEYDTGHIRKFTSSGTEVTTGGFPISTPHPTAIAGDSSGNIFVGVGDSDLIRKFTSAGVQVTTGGFPISTPDLVTDIVVDASGNIFASGYDNHVRKFTSAGVQVTTGGFPISTPLPYSVSIDSSGNILVIDIDNDLIKKFTSAGVQVTTGGFPISTPAPRAVAVDSSGNIFATDLANNRVHKFAPVTTSVGQIIETPIAAEQTFTATTTTELDVDEAWLIHPVFPSLSVSIDAGESADPDHLWVEESSGSQKTAASRGSVFRPIGRPRAVVFTNGSRQADEWSLVIGAPTISGKNAIRAVVDDETPLLLRLPIDTFDWDLPDGWYSVGDLSISRPETPNINPLTFSTLPLTPVDPPVVRQTAVWTYGSTLLVAPTYTDAQALCPTYLDRLAGEAS